MSPRTRVVMALASVLWIAIGAVHLAIGAGGPGAAMSTISVAAGVLSLAANGYGYYLGRRRR